MEIKKQKTPESLQCDQKYIDALKRIEPIVVMAYKCGEMNHSDIKKIVREIVKLGLTSDAYAIKFAN